MPLKGLAYDDWLEHAFGHEVRFGRDPWFFDDGQGWWAPSDAEFVAYLTRLFEHPEVLVEQFADSQIAQGLTYLVDTCAMGDNQHLSSRSVPMVDRLRLIHAIETLFEHLFAPRCTPHLSHLDEPGVGVLNARCYMWWDCFPTVALPGDPHLSELQQAALQTMRRILWLDSLACQESALHGLGHWHYLGPVTVETVIDEFIAGHAHARAELLTYARAARCGCVL